MSAMHGFDHHPSHIGHLPEEILQHIVNLLPLSDRKNMSLVSSAWNNLAFSFASMADVKLEMDGLRAPLCDLATLRRTMRPYRHLELFFGNQAWDELVVMEILSTLGPNIESFILMDECTPRQLREYVIRLPNLKMISVDVYDDECQTVGVDYFPIMHHLKEFRMKNVANKTPEIYTFLVAPNIQKLRVKLNSENHCLNQPIEVVKRYELQLQHVELFAPVREMRFEKLIFRQLQTLILWDVNCKRDERPLCEFFANLPMLRTAELHFNVSENLLRIICDKCPNLFKLMIEFGRLNKNSLRLISQLNNLRVLLVDGYISRDMLDGCSPMNGVEHFSLTKNPINSGASMDLLRSIFPKLRILKVDLTDGMGINGSFVHGICSSFRQLKCLKIDTTHMCSMSKQEPASARAFSRFVQLTNLEELTISCMQLTSGTCLFPHLFRKCFGNDWSGKPQINMRRLKLKNCLWVKGGNLVNIVRLFPLLQYLEVSQCRMITNEDMVAVRKLMPDCVVHYDKW